MGGWVDGWVGVDTEINAKPAQADDKVGAELGNKIVIKNSCLRLLSKIVVKILLTKSWSWTQACGKQNQSLGCTKKLVYEHHRIRLGIVESND